MGRQIGLQVRASAFSPEILNPWRLPVLIAMHDGQVGVLDKLDAAGNASVQFSGDQGLAQVLTLQQLQHSIQQVYILRPEKSIPDVRIDEYVKPYESSWFWSIVLRDWKRYIDVMFASLMANILALATVLFSMNVYDRVIPAQSIPTLWVLAGGVLLAAIFEFSIRVARIYLSDIIGKRADLKISDRVFGHALRIKNKDRSKSTGTFISQIRELEGVRELVTSTTISAVADLPFFLLFLGIFWLIGGDLFWVMLAVVPLMILPGILIQKPLAKLAAEGMREGAIRNATLVEADGTPDVGRVIMTEGFDLPSNSVIHTTWPVWRGGSHFESDLVGASYRNALRLAASEGIETLAFPAFSQMKLLHPHTRMIAMNQVTNYFNEPTGSLRQVIFCVDDDEDLW